MTVAAGMTSGPRAQRECQGGARCRVPGILSCSGDGIALHSPNLVMGSHGLPVDEVRAVRARHHGPVARRHPRSPSCSLPASRSATRDESGDRGREESVALPGVLPRPSDAPATLSPGGRGSDPLANAAQKTGLCRAVAQGRLRHFRDALLCPVQVGMGEGMEEDDHRLHVQRSLKVWKL